MADSLDSDVDFFVSYNGHDKKWAEWIAWQLENASFSVLLQAWDFRPGSNFVLEMNKATQRAKRTIVVLSPHFLASGFTQPEWAAAFAKDPTGSNRVVVPILVEATDVEGLLGPIVHIDLVGLDLDEAATALLAGIQPGRSKPTTPPPFPGGALGSASVPTRSYSPAAPVGLDWRPADPNTPVLWRADLPSNYRGSPGYTVVEIQLVPVDDILLQVRQLDLLQHDLATTGRQSGVFSSAQELETGASADAAFAKAAPSRSDEHAGIMVGRRGQRGAWISLPHDTMGSVFDKAELTARLVVIIGLLAGLNVPEAERYSVTARMGPLMMLVAGDQTVVGNRNSASMNMTGREDVLLPLEDSVRGAAIGSEAAELAEEVVARLASAAGF